MKVTIITSGSRGDVQPYIALGLGLKAAGHEAKIATHGVYGDWITGHGLDFSPVEGNPLEMIASGDAQEWLEAGQNLVKFWGEFRRLLKPLVTRAMQDVWAACEGADLILPSSLSYYAGFTASEGLGIPWMQTYLQPLHATREFPNSLLSKGMWLGSLGNRLSHYVAGYSFWWTLRGTFNAARKELYGSAPLPLKGIFGDIDKQGIPALYAFSSSVIPKPPDWAEHLHVTGYWFLEESSTWEPPAALTHFLDDGPAPVYVGFGSMTNRDPASASRLVLDALRQSGQRGLLLTGWGGVAEQVADEHRDDVFVLESAPHDWLFPRMAAVVHHGGAGTTAAGLRAGVPSIVIPFFSDQPWWGQMVYRKGTGPKPIPRKKLTAEKLANAISQAVNEQGMRERASKLGEAIRAEDGVGEAIRIINAYMAAP